MKPPPDLPTDVAGVVEAARNKRYPALYDVGGRDDLNEAVTTLIAAMRPSTSEGHRRLVRTALAFARAARAILLNHRPMDTRPDEAIAAVLHWLDDGSPVPDAQAWFPFVNVGHQAVNEATDVFHQLLRSVDPAEAEAAIVSVLDSSLEGYAIPIGKSEPRTVFDWWLDDVFPAVWHEREPLAYGAARS